MTQGWKGWQCQREQEATPAFASARIPLLRLEGDQWAEVQAREQGLAGRSCVSSEERGHRSGGSPVEWGLLERRGRRWEPKGPPSSDIPCRAPALTEASQQPGSLGHTVCREQRQLHRAEQGRRDGSTKRQTMRWCHRMASKTWFSLTCQNRVIKFELLLTGLIILTCTV